MPKYTRPHVVKTPYSIAVRKTDRGTRIRGGKSPSNLTILFDLVKVRGDALN